jgi:hypothetical protein
LFFFLNSLGYHLQFLSPTTKLFSRHQHTHVLRGGIAAISSPPLSPRSFLFECTADGTDARSYARGQRSSRCQRAPLRAEYPNLPCVPQEKKSRARRHVMSTASKLGPHTQTDRGTCPVVGL